MSTILLLGKSGQLGSALLQTLSSAGRIIAPDRAQLDLADPDRLRALVRDAKPDLIVNAAAYTAVDRAESDAALAMQVNGLAPGVLAEEARGLGAVLVHFSTDYVFEGTKTTPYAEDDVCRPVNAYGRSKLAGEQAIVACGGRYLILRTSWLYSERGDNFVLTMLKLARAKRELPVVADQTGSPTWARALAESTAVLIRKWAVQESPGIYHLSAGGSTSRFAFAQRIVASARRITGLDSGWATIVPITSSEYPTAAARPLACAMSTDKIARTFGISMRVWAEQLDEFLTGFLSPARRR